MKQAILLLLMVSTVAYGSIYQRQHADTIVSDKKILADDLNDEFNAILTAVNTIDSTNITDGSLTATDFAATSTGVTLNKKSGCDFSVSSDTSGTKNVDIKPPCEIFMDGTRGFITATETISLLTNQDGFAPGFSTYYYIYASRNSASLSFQFSTTPPTLATARKNTNSNARYVGTVRTCDATTDLVRVRRLDANKFVWTQDSCAGSGNEAPRIGLIASSSAAGGGGLSISANTIERVLLKYSAYTTSTYPAQCEFVIDSISLVNHQAIVTATGGNTGIVPFWGQPSQLGSSITVNNIKDCVTGGDLRVIGWSEPYSLHQ